MSRVGKKPIIIPSGVEVTLNGNTVYVKGPKGELLQNVNASVHVALEQIDGSQMVQVNIDDESDRGGRAQWGTARSLIQNMVQGVTEGFSKKLEVNGVGYRVNMQGKNLLLNLGFSHDVSVEIPEGITASVEGNMITISGFDKQAVGEVAAAIRRLRKPEPYKGKGIKYVGEIVRRKAGKTQKSGS